MKRRTVTEHEQQGQTLVEVLIAIALSAILLPALVTGVVASREGRAQEGKRLQATALLHEAQEAVRSVREKGWNQFPANGTYHPAISGTAWSLSNAPAGPETIGIFTRQVMVSDAQRDTSGALVNSGGTTDPSTKKVVISVTWGTPLPGTVSTTAYVQRYLSNAAWTQTTFADFLGGVKTNTQVVNTSGGEVQLAPGPPINWSAPTVAGSYDVPANTLDANDVYVDTVSDRAYVAVGSTLQIINVSNPASPALLGTYTAGGQVNGVYVSGNFAYLATASNTGELTVVNVTTPSAPTTASSLNLGDNNNATSIFVSGTFAYVGKVNSATAGINEFYIVNVTTPSAPALSGSLNLSNAVNSIFVSGNFAYVATSITNAELTVINITNKTTPTSAGTFNTAGTTSIATDVFAVGTTVYLVENNNTGGGEFFILNAATPSAVTQVGTFEEGANVNGVYISGTNAFLATAKTNQQFIVLDIATPSAPAQTGATNLGAATNDVFFDGANAFLSSTSDTQELAIMQGTFSGFQTSGTFESSTFDAGATVGFNYLTFTLTEPANTDIQFQVATNTDNATWNYVGPDGTAGTTYTAPAAIPLTKVSGRYLRYKATLTTTNTSATPVFSDASINYSP